MDETIIISSFDLISGSVPYTPTWQLAWFHSIGMIACLVIIICLIYLIIVGIMRCIKSMVEEVIEDSVKDKYLK